MLILAFPLLMRITLGRNSDRATGWWCRLAGIAANHRTGSATDGTADDSPLFSAHFIADCGTGCPAHRAADNGTALRVIGTGGQQQ